MTIILNDEQTRLLSEVVQAGAARSTEEAVDQAVRILHSLTTGKRPVYQQVDNLADLFAKSPQLCLSSLRGGVRFREIKRENLPARNAGHWSALRSDSLVAWSAWKCNR